MLGLGQEVKEITLVKLGLAEHSSLQELLAAVVECAVEEGKEDSSVFVKDVTVGIVQLAKDVDIAENGVRVGCHDECGQILFLRICNWVSLRV